MEVKYKKLIKSVVFFLADQVAGIAKSNDSAKKHIAQTCIGQYETSQTTYCYREPL